MSDLIWQILLIKLEQPLCKELEHDGCPLFSSDALVCWIKNFHWQLMPRKKILFIHLVGNILVRVFIWRCHGDKRQRQHQNKSYFSKNGNECFFFILIGYLRWLDVRPDTCLSVIRGYRQLEWHHLYPNAKPFTAIVQISLGFYWGS